MHWLEKWMRKECSVATKKNPCEDCREACAPCLILHQMTGASIYTIKKLALEPGYITCAALANRIAQATGATAAQRDMLVHPDHHGEWKPDGRKRRLKLPKAETQTPAHEPVEAARALVMIDRQGRERARYASVAEAILGSGCKRIFITNHCERRLGGTTDEFAPVNASFRWADEWDAMTDAERRADAEKQSIGGRMKEYDRRKYDWQGESHTVAEWARIVNLPEATLRKRLKTGWDFETAIRTPVKER